MTASKNPKLRFKDENEKDFPDWKKLKISDIVFNYGGTSLESHVRKEGKYKFISIGNYSKDGLYIDNGQRVELNDKTISKKLNKNDLVMVLNDKTSSGDIIGSTILISNDNFIYNQRSERLVCKEDFIPKFVWFLFNSNKIRKEIFKISQGGTQIYVNYPSVSKIQSYIPNKAEQIKITNFLTSVDGYIQSLKSQKEELEIYKKGLMQKIFSQQLRFKDATGKDFPDWKNCRLEDLLSYEQPSKYIVKDTTYSPYYNTPVLTAGKSFILGYTNEGSGIFRKEKLPVIIFDDFTTAFKIVNFPFKVKSSALKILHNKNEKISNINFIFNIMLMINFNLGEEHKRYWISEYSKIKIDLPLIEEQNKIADFLTNLDYLIEIKNKEIENAENWKKGLMQQMFI